MPEPKKCKKCGVNVEEIGGYSCVTESRELVVVYEPTETALIMNEGDCLCDKCGKVVVYYRRIKE